MVTALFADLTGSTPLGELLDPEEYKIVVDEAVSRMIAAAQAYGGTVVNVAGDGILVLFGAPISHEDDPERALRAALDIISDVSAYGSRGGRGLGGRTPDRERRRALGLGRVRRGQRPSRAHGHG